jgi:hypothetical protein
METAGGDGVGGISGVNLGINLAGLGFGALSSCVI